MKIRQSQAYVGCLQAQDMADLKANVLNFEVTRLTAEFQKVLVMFDNKLADMDDADWKTVLKECSDIAYILNERRTRVKEKLGINQETLIEELAVDGYHAWGDLYDSIIGQIQIPYEEDGKTEILSVGQANNLTSKPDRNIRRAVSKIWTMHGSSMQICSAARSIIWRASD